MTRTSLSRVVIGSSLGVNCELPENRSFPSTNSQAETLSGNAFVVTVTMTNPSTPYEAVK